MIIVWLFWIALIASISTSANDRSLNFFVTDRLSRCTHLAITKCAATFQSCLRGMGVEVWLQWTAWFIESTLLMLITISVFTLLLCTPIPVGNVTVENAKTLQPQRAAIISCIEPCLLFAFLVAYALASITYSLAISACLTKCKIGDCLVNTS